MLISKRGSMLEVYQPNNAHPRSASSSVVTEQVYQGEKEVVEVEVGKACLGSEGRGKIDMGTIQAVVDDMLATHGAVSCVLRVIGLAFFFLFLAGNGAAGDGRVQLQHTVKAFGECELEGTTDLTVCCNWT